MNDAPNDQWRPGMAVPPGGLALGALSHWEMLMVSPTAASLLPADLDDDRLEIVAESVRRSLRARDDRTSDDTTGLIRDRERTALEARSRCRSGLTVRGPAPSGSVCFEVHIGRNYAVVDVHDDDEVHFVALDSSEWPGWLETRLAHELGPAPVTDGFAPVYILRAFRFEHDHLHVVDTVIGCTGDGVGLAFANTDPGADPEAVEVFELNRSDLVTFLGDVWGRPAPSDGETEADS